MWALGRTNLKEDRENETVYMCESNISLFHLMDTSCLWGLPTIFYYNLAREFQWGSEEKVIPNGDNLSLTDMVEGENAHPQAAL